MGKKFIVIVNRLVCEKNQNAIGCSIRCFKKIVYGGKEEPIQSTPSVLQWPNHNSRSMRSNMSLLYKRSIERMGDNLNCSQMISKQVNQESWCVNIKLNVLFVSAVRVMKDQITICLHDVIGDFVMLFQNKMTQMKIRTMIPLQSKLSLLSLLRKRRKR